MEFWRMLDPLVWLKEEEACEDATNALAPRRVICRGAALKPGSKQQGAISSQHLTAVVERLCPVLFHYGCHTIHLRRSCAGSPTPL
jgi:hypothetical protein